MDVTTIGFYVAALVTLGSAVGVVASKEIVRAAGYLIIALLGVAALFALMGSLFVASLQVLVYAGAVIILFLFGVMLTRSEKPSSRVRQLIAKENIGYILFAVLLILDLTLPLYHAPSKAYQIHPIQQSSISVSISLFQTYKGVLYAVAALTAASAMGAIYLVKKPRPQEARGQ